MTVRSSVLKFVHTEGNSIRGTSELQSSSRVGMARLKEDSKSMLKLASSEEARPYVNYFMRA
jgi:hypothetical protein